MLDPKARIVLLPQDREIMDITGLSEAEYREFARLCIAKSGQKPGEITMDFGVSLAVSLLVGALMTGVSMLLAPKPQTQQSNRLEESTVDGQDIVRKDRFSPRSGFDSLQNVVEIGSVVPIVYAKREVIDGKQYGGIRINTNLLWSQIMSIGGGQFFRGIFLIGEASNTQGPSLDFTQTALGNNTLVTYDLDGVTTAGRASLYYSAGDGRITENEHELGVEPAEDIGCKDVKDVYAVEGANNTLGPNFCMSVQPTNQNVFGVYSMIGNGFCYKLGEKFEALTQWQNRKDGEWERQDSNQKKAENQKNATRFNLLCGFVDGNDIDGDVNVDQILTYKIFKQTEEDLEFTEGGSSSGGEQDSVVRSQDVASTVASIQRGYDEIINVGEMYRAGSALLICISREGDNNPNGPFVSENDVTNASDANTITARFKVISKGKLHRWKESSLTKQSTHDDSRLATNSSHLFRCSIASISLERPARVIEVGFKSRLGMQVTNIANFNSLRIPNEYEGKYKSYQDYVDSEYCGGQVDGDAVDESYRKDIKTGSYTSSDFRYTFFKIAYRNADSNSNDFETLEQVYGVRSQTSVASYNFMRIEFPDEQRREIRFIPLTGWEIRNSIDGAAGNLHVMDPHVDTLSVNTDINGVKIRFNGISNFARNVENLGLKAFRNYNTATEGAVTQGTILSGGRNYHVNADPPYKRVYNDVPLRNANPGNDGYGATAQITVDRRSIDPKNPLKGYTGQVVDVKIEETGAGYVKNQILEVNNKDITPNGTSATGSGFTFRVNSTGTVLAQPIGNYPMDDPDTEFYVDGYARLAEDFIYDEVKNTATEPEHQISYVNIINEASGSGPQYQDLSLIGLNIRSSKELQRLDQLSVYVKRGVIDSHLFPDVYTDLLTNTRYGTGQFFDSKQIDSVSFAAAAAWTEGRQYFFDGAISQKLNLRSWGAERAADFLLDLGVSGGKFTLNPVANFDGEEAIAALFTAGNIIDDTLEVNYFDLPSRLSPRVSVKWREERRSLAVGDRGLFPQTKEVTVRRKDSFENAPLEQIDMSSFCTNEQHAIDRAKWLCQQRHYITHAVKFKTTPTEATINVGSIIKLGIETISYEQPQNGAIGPDGTVTSWPTLGNGEHGVLIWDGQKLSEERLAIKSGKADKLRNCVFCIKNSNNKAEAYKVESIGFDEDGNVDIEAFYWPLEDNGVSKLTKDFDDKHFIIET